MTDTAPPTSATAPFITLEGGEGTGKSTQIARLAARLSAAGIGVVATREPGGTPFAEQARLLALDRATAPQSALAQALLFNAARAEHIDRVIRPQRAAGTWVLCDRFSDSTRAYQGAAGGVDAAILSQLDHIVTGGCRPDLTILLDLDPHVGMMRANQRRTSASPGTFIAADTFESRHLDFHQRLRLDFLAIAKAEPHRVQVVDAFQNELMIADQIWQHVCERFAALVPAANH